MVTPKRYQLTDKGMEDALNLLEGVPPSELGYTFLQAAIALALLEAHLKDVLAKVRHLKETYAEAARLVEPEQK